MAQHPICSSFDLCSSVSLKNLPGGITQEQLMHTCTTTGKFCLELPLIWWDVITESQTLQILLPVSRCPASSSLTHSHTTAPPKLRADTPTIWCFTGRDPLLLDWIAVETFDRLGYILS